MNDDQPRRKLKVHSLRSAVFMLTCTERGTKVKAQSIRI